MQCRKNKEYAYFKKKIKYRAEINKNLHIIVVKRTAVYINTERITNLSV